MKRSHAVHRKRHAETQERDGGCVNRPPSLLAPLDPARHPSCKDRQSGKDRQDVSRQFRRGQREEHERHGDRPGGQPHELGVVGLRLAPQRSSESSQPGKENERPRKQPTEDDEHEEVHRLRMRKAVGQEASEVMVDEELLDEGPSVDRDYGHVPDSGNKSGRRRGSRGVDHPQPAPCTARHHITGHDHPYEQRAGKSLRKHRRACRRAERGRPRNSGLRRRRRFVEEKCAQRESHRRRERHIEARAPGKGQPQGGRREHHCRDRGSPRPSRPSCRRVDGSDGGHREARGTKPCGRFRDSGDRKSGGHQPVRKRRFLEPRVTGEPGRDPVAGRDHLARDLGITRLVLSKQRNTAKAKQEAHRHEGDYACQCPPLPAVQLS